MEIITRGTVASSTGQSFLYDRRCPGIHLVGMRCEDGDDRVCVKHTLLGALIDLSPERTFQPWWGAGNPIMSREIKQDTANEMVV